MAKPYLVQTVDECFACTFFDKTTEGRFGHIGYPRHLSQGYRFIVIIVHIFKHLRNASASIIELLVGKTLVRKRAHIARDRQIMQYRKQLQHRIKSRLFIKRQ